MFDKHTNKDWATAGITAALGAGIVTTLAVSHGQNVFVALGITGFATVVALVVDHYL